MTPQPSSTIARPQQTHIKRDGNGNGLVVVDNVVLGRGLGADSTQNVNGEEGSDRLSSQPPSQNTSPHTPPLHGDEIKSSPTASAGGLRRSSRARDTPKRLEQEQDEAQARLLKDKQRQKTTARDSSSEDNSLEVDEGEDVEAEVNEDDEDEVEEEEEEDDEEEEGTLYVPSWLPAIMPSERHRFFSPCEVHSLRKRNERVFFATHEHEALCQHCCSERGLTTGSPNARDDGAVRIRRYVYMDVLDRNDAVHHCAECEGVQPYVLNGNRVIFLASRGNGRGGTAAPVPQPTGGAWNCHGCQRMLKDRFRYCSVECCLRVIRKHAASGTRLSPWTKIRMGGGSIDKGEVSAGSAPSSDALPPPSRKRNDASRVRMRKSSQADNGNGATNQTTATAATKRKAVAVAPTQFIKPFIKSQSRRKKAKPCRAPMS